MPGHAAGWAAIREFFRAAWAAARPTVPVEYTGEPGFYTGASGLTVSPTQPTIPYVAVTIEEGRGPTVFAIGSGKTWEHGGTVLVECFAPDTGGTLAAHELADAAVSIFLNSAIPASKIRFTSADGAGPGSRYIGTKNGWHKFLVEAPFLRFETTA